MLSLLSSITYSDKNLLCYVVKINATWPEQLREHPVLRTNSECGGRLNNLRFFVGLVPLAFLYML